jgi:hypothetical protein
MKWAGVVLCLEGDLERVLSCVRLLFKFLVGLLVWGEKRRNLEGMMST